jgi:hypothetical protein
MCHETQTAGLGESMMVRSESVREMLTREARRKLVAVEGINCGKSLAFVNQLCNLVSCFFDLANYFFRVFFCVQQDDHKDEVGFGPDLIKGIAEATDELLQVKATRKSWTRIWSGIQRHVKGSSVRAIDNWSHLRASSESSPAMRAIAGVSIQRNTPIAGAGIENREAAPIGSKESFSACTCVCL